MRDFLLELLSEEIPARMQDKARADLERLFADELGKSGLKAATIKTFATPRRLALIATGLPDQTEAVREETKGPKTSAPPQALEGFLRKTGLTQDQLEDRDGIYFAVVEKPGRPMADVLAQVIPAIVAAFPWPKSMRWGARSVSTESQRWVRPLHGIVALLGGDHVACSVDGIASSAETQGHRFHHQGLVRISNPAAYAEALRAAHVLVDQDERQAIVRTGAEKAASSAGLVLVTDEGLVKENAGLTEWPVPMLGRFDPAFLNVPEEVIQLTARVNQKYFICRDGAGKLANAFVCTANISASDGGAAIVAGNEKVLAARLSDAKFFWEQDLKVLLEVQAEKLKQIVFHEKLGTVADKVERVAKLARWLCETGVITSPLPQAGAAGSGQTPASAQMDTPTPNPSRMREGESLADLAERAARLCKADLVTGMVGEFPELQGVMGGYYARAQGESDAVADAVRDHYKPVGQGDDVPTAPVTVAVSLADKLDTLAQFFAEDLKPTGSKDPFALRRAALSFLELISKNQVRVRLFGVFNHAVSLRKPDNQIIADAIIQFLIDRLKVQQREAGVRHDLIDAVFALGSEDDLVRLLARVNALQNFVTTDDGTNLLAGYKRAANILRIEGEPDVAPAAPSEPQEIALLAALDAAEPKAQAAVEAEDFEGAMAALALLRAPIDTFFDSVMVNDADPAKRAARLGMLKRVRDAVHRVADFSKIEG